MKYALIFILFLLLNNIAAQQSLLLNQSVYNLFILTPSAAGLNGELHVNAHLKKNWIGLIGGPKRSLLTVDGVMNSKSGLGLKINSSRAGIFSQTNLSGAFRYKIQLSKGHYLSFGAEGGFQRAAIDFTKVNAHAPEELAGWQLQPTKFSPDAGAGLLYETKKSKLIFGAEKIIANSIRLENSIANHDIYFQDQPSFLLGGQYKFFESHPLSFMPAVILRAVKGSSTQYELSATAFYKEVLMLGIGYRSDLASYANIGFIFNQNVKFIYSYEYSLNIQNYLKGGHEVGLSITIKNRIQTTGYGRADFDQASLMQNIDQQTQDITLLNQKIDSLHKNLLQSKKEIEDLKQKQILPEELRKTFHERDKELISTDKNLRNQSRKETYIMVEPGIHSAIDSSAGNFRIVFGVYQQLEYAKKFQKVVKRELNEETVLLKPESHSKQYIYTCSLHTFSTLTEGIKELNRIKKQHAELKTPITYGNLWILQTIIPK